MNTKNLIDLTSGISLNEAIQKIVSNSDPMIKGCIHGMLSSIVLYPTAGLALHAVKDVHIEGAESLVCGYMFTFTPTEQDAKRSYDEVCQLALMQRFVGVDDNGTCILFTPTKYGSMIDTPKFLN